MDIDEEKLLQKIGKHLLEEDQIPIENLELNKKIDLNEHISIDIFDNILEIDLGIDNLEVKQSFEYIENNSIIENNSNIEIKNTFDQNHLNNHDSILIKNEDDLDKSKRKNKKRKKNDNEYEYDYETDKYIDSDDNSSIKSETTEISVFKPNLLNKRISVFMQKIDNICCNKKNNEIINFFGEGGIIFYDIELFEKTLLNEYFGNIMMRSFVKMLNIYRFMKIPSYSKENKNLVVYSNEYFMKNNQNRLEDVMLNKNNTKQYSINTNMTATRTKNTYSKRLRTSKNIKFDDIIEQINLIKKKHLTENKDFDKKDLIEKLKNLNNYIESLFS